VLASSLLVLTVSCSSDDDGDPVDLDPLEQIKQATFAAGSAAYEGAVVFADGSTGPVAGTSQAEPPAGQVTYPLSTATGPQELEVIWTDGTIYVDRVVTAERGEVSLTQRVAESKPWVRSPYQGLTITVFQAYDPFRLLEWLTARNSVATPDGSEEVGSDELDRYVVDLSGEPITPAGAQRIELLADADQRLHTVRLTGADRVEYSISEFGVAVDPTPPPADQIDVAGNDPAIQPTGPYEPVASGTSIDGVAWQLLQAPAPDGYTCWRLDAPGPLDPVAATQPDGASCIPPYDPEATIDQQVQIVVDSGGAAAFDAVVAVVPPGTTGAELLFDDASREQLTVDPQGFVVYVGPRDPFPTVLTVTGPGGIEAVCGPGSVSSLEDLGDLPADEVLRLASLPWLCLEG
jgi:hypothetical protein